MRGDDDPDRAGSAKVTAPGTRGATGRASVSPSDEGDRIAHRDRPRVEDVGVQPAAVEEVIDDPGPGQRLQVKARLAELDALASTSPTKKRLPTRSLSRTPRTTTWRRDSGPLRPTSSSTSASISVIAPPGRAPRAEVAVALEALPATAVRTRPAQRVGLADRDRLDLHGPQPNGVGRQLCDRVRARGRPRLPRRPAESSAFGMAMQPMPAALAERIPLWESSIATQPPGSVPSRRAASR